MTVPTVRAALLALAFAVAPAAAQEASRPAQPVQYSSGNFGGVGLIQTRTARFAPDGEFTFHTSHADAYRRYSLTWQFLPWVETTLRYTRSQVIGEDYLDKSADVKVKIWKERRRLPAFAIGAQDLIGTDLFGAKYFVFSKRVGPFDLSVGNILTGYGRGSDDGWFGGIEYFPPIRDLSLKLEYEANDYSREPATEGDLAQDTPFNIGATYRLFDWMDLGVEYQRGEELVAGISFRSNFQDARSPPKTLDPLPAPFWGRPGSGTPRTSPASGRAADQGDMARKVFPELERQGIQGESLRLSDERVELGVTPGQFPEVARIVGRAARTAANHAPEAVEEIAVDLRSDGLPLARVALSRSRLEELEAGSASEIDVLADARVSRPEPRPGPGAALNSPGDGSLSSRFRWNLHPTLRPFVGTPEHPVLVEAGMRFNLGVNLRPGLNLRSSVRAGIYDNFDRIRSDRKGTLEPVRTRIRDYLRDRTLEVTRAQVDYVYSSTPDWYARLAAGYLERMFGGVSGEVLYRPQTQPWALGLELSHVRQRETGQGPGFLDYRTTTGHLSLYYQLPWYGMRATVHAGRYLAGDWGATFELLRRFESGIEFGGFFSRTNASAEEFGEGEFDKGITVNIPLNVIVPFSTRAVAPVNFRPLTSDGGQRLNAGPRLYGLTEDGQLDSLMRDDGAVLWQ